MDNENHKNIWNNFTKFVLWGTVAVIAVLVLMAIFLLQCFIMRIGSVSENKNFEKRIAVTPEIAKKYISLGFEVFLSENYGDHLGFNDNEYKELGVKISNNENEIITESFDYDWKLYFTNNSSLLKNKKTFSYKNLVLEKDPIIWGFKTVWYGRQIKNYKTHPEELNEDKIIFVETKTN